jgi:very-short-patch-repair endonuclease
MHKPTPLKQPLTKRSVTRFQRVSPAKLELAKKMRRNMTFAERCFWNAVRANKIPGMHFHRQQVIDGFIADFYCADHRLVVEIDGGVHEFQRAHDAQRDIALQKNGLKVLRFKNEDVVDHIEHVIEQVKSNRKISP